MSETLKKLLAALGAPESTDETQAIAQVAALKAQADQVPALTAQVAALKTATPDPAKFAPVEAMQALQTEVAALRADASARVVDELVKPALAEGKLLPAQETWARDLGKTNLAALKAYLETAQPLAALQGTQTNGRGPGSADDGQPLEARCKAEWEKSAALREEFGTLATYTAYAQANAAGQVRMLKKGDAE